MDDEEWTTYVNNMQISHNKKMPFIVWDKTQTDMRVMLYQNYRL